MKALIFAVQQQAPRTGYACQVQHRPVSEFLQKDETVNHIFSECETLSQREYERTYNNITWLIHWELFGKYDMSRSQKVYKHNQKVQWIAKELRYYWKLPSNVTIQSRPERLTSLFSVEKESNNQAIIVNIASPWEGENND